MRPTAKVKPITLVVNFQIFVARNGVNKLDFVVLAFRGKNFLGFFPAPNSLPDGISVPLIVISKVDLSLFMASEVEAHQPGLAL